MKEIQLGEDERRVLAEASLVARYGEDESPIRPEQIIEPRRREDVGQNLWMTYNTIQENIIRGGLHGRKRNAEGRIRRSEEHTSELQSLMRISYAVFCLKKKTRQNTHKTM